VDLIVQYIFTRFLKKEERKFMSPT